MMLNKRTLYKISVFRDLLFMESSLKSLASIVQFEI